VTGAGLKCTSAGATGCTSQQASGAKVTITANAAPGSTFTGWSGACTGTATSCLVTMTAAKSVTASFAKSAASNGTLTITVSGGGTVKTATGACTVPAKQTKSCTQEQPIGSKVTLTATPALGLAFAGWKGACTGGTPVCTVTMAAATAVTASFAKPLLVASHKPVVTRVSGAFQIHLAYSAAEAGTLKLVVTRSGVHVLTKSKEVKAGNGKLVVPVSRKGRYVLQLTLKAKSGSQSIHWVVVV